MTQAIDALPDDLNQLKALLLAERARNERLVQIIKEMRMELSAQTGAAHAFAGRLDRGAKRHSQLWCASASVLTPKNLLSFSSAKFRRAWVSTF